MWVYSEYIKLTVTLMYHISKFFSESVCMEHLNYTTVCVFPYSFVEAIPLIFAKQLAWKCNWLLYSNCARKVASHSQFLLSCSGVPMEI